MSLPSICILFVVRSRLCSLCVRPVVAGPYLLEAMHTTLYSTTTPAGWIHVQPNTLSDFHVTTSTLKHPPPSLSHGILVMTLVSGTHTTTIGSTHSIVYRRLSSTWRLSPSKRQGRTCTIFLTNALDVHHTRSL